MFSSPRVRLTDRIPLGVLVILLLAVLSTFYIAMRDEKEPEGRELWTFINVRPPVYNELIEEWGLEGDDHVRVELIAYDALRRRLLSGFFSGTPLPDMVEAERDIASATWRGPIEAVGFVDLTERLMAEGLFDKINRPSFSPWTNRGRVFGMPSDVHPVLLCYRADIFEEAGIDVEELDTWDKYFAATRKLVKDFNGDGYFDQFVFEMSETTGMIAETLILQAGGYLIDAEGRPAMNDPLNIDILAQIADWSSGHDQVSADVDLYTGAGHRLRGDGFVLSWLVPDWRSRTVEMYSGNLAGKVKLMPMPAWQEGGRRTSAWGGTMMGFPKSSESFEENWEFAKRLYLSRELAIRMWDDFSVLTPVKEFWSDPFFHQPDPFYGGQRKAELFIDQANNVPIRSSSPYISVARQELANAVAAIVRWARQGDVEDEAMIKAKAAEVLDKAQESLIRQMKRNDFITFTGEGPKT